MKKKLDLIKKELEKQFTGVTYLYSGEVQGSYNVTVWRVNEQKEQIVIDNEWEVENILNILNKPIETWVSE